MTRRIAIDWTSDEALLIRALLRDPAHQKAIELIWRKACGVGEMPFVDGDDGRRLTDFNLGTAGGGAIDCPALVAGSRAPHRRDQKTADEPAKAPVSKSKTDKRGKP
jgi:hypothetical protein